MSSRISSLSHTADVGFQVEASTREALFVGAADGLIGALTDEAGGSMASDGDDEGDGGIREETWSLSRPDLDRLLVAWLRELLHRALGRGQIPGEVAVRFTGETALEAEIAWLPPERTPEIVREIKGVTYHGLEAREGDDGWHARVVLDV